MCDKIESFVFYRSFYEATKRIPKRHRSALYDAIFDYIFEQKEPQLEGTSDALWCSFKPQLDANLKRYANAKKGGKYGKTGGRPRKEGENKKPFKGFENKTPNVNENVNVNDNDNANVNVNANQNGAGFKNPPAFIPSVYEVQTYITEQAGIRHVRPDFDANRFLTYYNARGWMAGSTRLTDWRALVDSWLEKTDDFAIRDSMTDETEEEQKRRLISLLS